MERIKWKALNIYEDTHKYNFMLSFIARNWKIILKPTVYFLAVGINRGMPFLLIPFLTRYLTPEEYGYLGIASVIIGGLRIFIGFNPSLFVITKFSAIDKKSMAEYIYVILVIVIATSILSLGVMAVLVPFFETQYKLHHNLLLIITLTSALMGIEALALVVIQMRKKAGSFFLFSILSAFLQILAVGIMVVVLKLSWQGKILGDLLALIFVCVTLLFYLFKQGYIRANKSFSKTWHFIKFSLPLLPHAISLWGMNFVDRFFLAKFDSVDAVGVYTVAYTIGMGMMLIYDALQRTWQPYFFETLNSNNDFKKSMLIKITWIYYLGCIILFFLATKIIQEIGTNFIKGSFLPALKFIPMIFLGYTFHGMYRAVAGYLYHANRNGLLSIVTMSSFVLNVVLNVVLIPKYGAMGAAEATMFTFLYSFIVVQIISTRVVKMPWLSVFHTNK